MEIIKSDEDEHESFTGTFSKELSDMQPLQSSEVVIPDSDRSPSPLFIDRHERVPRYADRGIRCIKGESYPKPMTGVVGTIYSPVSFFVIPEQAWLAEHKVMEGIQLSYLDMSDEDKELAKIRRPKDIRVGMQVAVFIHGEWNRARILKINPESEKPFEVRLTDFGDKVEVDLEDLRYLLNDWKGTYEPAVECQLVTCTNYGRQPRKGVIRRNWLANQRRAFHNIVFDRAVRVDFLGSSKNEYDETVWKVTISLEEEVGNPLADKKYRYYHGTDPPVDQSKPKKHNRGYLPGQIERILDRARWGDVHKYDHLMDPVLISERDFEAEID